MTLAAGTRLGNYEIVAPLGAGGMGEVFRARDTRLSRDVAIKVLPESFANDAVALARFTREARAVAALSHPGILAIHDFGSENGTAYAVMELLEGETLRRRLASGAIPPRKAVEYAREIALALAAAHEKGIVHRDLKPENIFVTHEGRVKLLDFGLAKENAALREAGDTESPTIPRDTDPGTVLGTAGYMSPEQVRGRAVDHRSDIFSFGTVLYEMLSGRRAFHGESAADTMSAILNQDPPDPSESGRTFPPALDRIVRHCLEKNPAERFQSARDLVFDLDALSTPSATAPAAVIAGARYSRRRWLWPVLVVLAAAVGLLAGARSLGRRAPMPTFHALTFKRGSILCARFAPDGQTAVYSAAWEGRPDELFATRFDGPQSRPLGLGNADLLSISRAGKVALLLAPKILPGWAFEGTLAEASLGGGAPRALREKVSYADLSPDGSTLAIVNQAGGGWQLEYPAGRVIATTSGWFSHPRVSPDGRLVAVCDHPQPQDDGGSVSVVEPGHPPRALTKRFATVQGLAFSPGGREIWFTAAETGANRQLWSVTFSGRTRPLLTSPGALTLHDVDAAGRLLVTRESDRVASFGLAPGETQERDISELDYSRAMGLSADGKTALLDESGEGGGPGYSVYVKRLDGSPAVRISSGAASDLSADGAWALVLDLGSPQQILQVPTGAGEPRALTHDAIAHEEGARWVAGTGRIAFFGSEPGHPRRLWIQDVGGKPRPVTPEGTRGLLHSVSHDGRTALIGMPPAGAVMQPLDGGASRAIPGIAASDRPAGWSSDDRSVFLVERDASPARIVRVDLATGARERVRDLTPADPAGLRRSVAVAHVTGDGRGYVYFVNRILSDLYLVDGLR